jgi:hypothetical protein
MDDMTNSRESLTRSEELLKKFALRGALIGLVDGAAAHGELIS